MKLGTAAWLKRFCFLAVCLGLAGCAPAGVPDDATSEWTLKTGRLWHWTRQLDHGCVSWSARDAHASLLLLVNSRCEESYNLSYLKGTGVSFSSDEIVFLGYWQQGPNVGGGKPCAHKISDAQIAELRALTAKAISNRTTPGEGRVLHRLDVRLSKVKGDRLMTHYSGSCSDLTQEDWKTGYPVRKEVWLSE